MAKSKNPQFSLDFPAHRLETNLTWDDLILDPGILDQINHIISWIVHEDQILGRWKLGKHIKPGYRTLFYGPAGTGKTLAATLLGQRTGLDVYRVDLSMVISKFIGETEKNLAAIFDRAEKESWILFFDEADALFGKRTSVTSSNDRHANQATAYLLQRIEDFPGVVILASNMRANIDDAFTRRFQSLVHFPMPDAEQRRRLWQNALGDGETPLETNIDLDEVAKKFELTGGAVVNSVRYAATNAMRHERSAISQSDLLEAIRREMQKEGKAIV